MKEKKLIYICLSIIVIFIASIIIFDPLVSDVSLLPDTGASHYYWKLPSRDLVTMRIVWMLFIVQLLSNYYLIMKRMKNKKYGLKRENYLLLIVNMVFLFIHLIQSIIFYDGLAQDVSVFSSQFSVIFVLVTMILMLNNQRGVIFGKKLPISNYELKPIYALHGLVFTFSIVYTFWYHPTINTIGHLFGFLYLSLFFIQIALVKTKMHLQIKWLTILEVLVVFHAMSVAYFVQSSSLWAMFGFGFGFIFVCTQIYGLAISKTVRRVIQFSFGVLAVTYYVRTNITDIHQILWIPIVEYALVLIMFGILSIKKQFITK